ncbi:MAG TPA: hypothetical protein HA282_05700 [Nanoarchaeota archaeon]|nr:MAG: hypothetical protein QT01_C0001G0089 [archaeon GW2011_AR6]MBS3082579.1 hypothetical protein [Candidatus Pacearchaeota archaeon]HIH17460.1 hypothetical protein [Nanoarchaeota archaeon]HIH33957.1 hypothetical protein [Nanoarchaeota archaeon]HIH51752.1 hypothetical protein [Nanoarchaeota archaeon]
MGWWIFGKKRASADEVYKKKSLEMFKSSKEVKRMLDSCENLIKRIYNSHSKIRIVYLNRPIWDFGSGPEYCYEIVSHIKSLYLKILELVGSAKKSINSGNIAGVISYIEDVEGALFSINFELQKLRRGVEYEITLTKKGKYLEHSQDYYISLHAISESKTAIDSSKNLPKIASLAREIKLLLLREIKKQKETEKASKELRDILNQSEIASHPEVEKALDELSGR